ncbi:MAG: laccase domain-containing protein [Acidimicrobiales bacterium]
MRQVHGREVVVVTRPGEHAGAAADAAVTAQPGCVLTVLTADCAPVVLLGERTVGVAHAGWRGLVEGVLERTVAAMAEVGDPPTVAHLGPCIRPGCYEFVGPERDLLLDRFGPAVAATTSWGSPAVDLPAAVALALGEVGVALDDDSGCTACDQRWYSHRARRDPERFATTAWIEP